MDILILGMCLIVALCCLFILFASFILLTSKFEPKNTEQVQEEETELEKETRRVAMEAQRYYEQGFVNLMNYDGQPGRKVRDSQ